MFFYFQQHRRTRTFKSFISRRASKYRRRCSRHHHHHRHHHVATATIISRKVFTQYGRIHHQCSIGGALNKWISYDVRVIKDEGNYLSKNFIIQLESWWWMAMYTQRPSASQHKNERNKTRVYTITIISISITSSSSSSSSITNAMPNEFCCCWC